MTTDADYSRLYRFVFDENNTEDVGPLADWLEEHDTDLARGLWFCQRHDVWPTRVTEIDGYAYTLQGLKCPRAYAVVLLLRCVNPNTRWQTEVSYVEDLGTLLTALEYTSG